MIHWLPVAILGSLLPAWAMAEGVNKCVAPSGVSYQSQPCDSGQVSVPMQLALAPTPDAPPAPSSWPRAVKIPGVTPPAPPAERPTNPPPANAVASTPECAKVARKPSPMPWRYSVHCIGMTDDEVLNLPGWGRPSKIARTRGAREWREDWRYDARASAARILHFVNGALAAVEIESDDAAIGPLANAPDDRVLR